MEPHTHTNDVTRHFNGQHTALHRLGMSILATTATTDEQSAGGGLKGERRKAKGGLDVCISSKRFWGAPLHCQNLTNDVRCGRYASVTKLKWAWPWPLDKLQEADPLAPVFSRGAH